MATRNTNITVPKLEKGVIGGDIDRWGYKWNENIDKLSEFHTKVIADSEMQNQELARLENEKLNIEDIPSKVEPVVQEFLETTIKPEIDDYVDTVSKPDITNHVETKKQEINTYVNTTSKPALDSYEKEKEKELNTYTTTKKGELDSHTIAKKGELDAYEKTKETQLNNYTGTKQTQLDSYTNTRKGELDTHTTAKEGQLDTYTTGKEGELDTHTGKKKSELDAYEKTKEGELNTFTSAKKTEITNHTNTKKGELDTYTTQKKGEITTHTDSEIERINADSELANKANKTVQVIAGNGLVGGGDLSTNRTLNIASADDGITVNADNIKLNIVDNATTDSATRAGSARQIKLLSENKQNKTDSGLQTESKEIIGSINESLWRIISKDIPDNSDLNNYFKAGFFKSTNTGFNISNKPIGITSHFNLIVLTPQANEGSSHATQILYPYATNKIYTRYRHNNNWYDWKEILTENSKLFLGTSGISSVTYIQDSGTKTQGQGYIDKSTGQVYLCLETNTDTTITNKFMSITNVELGKKVKQNTDDKVDKADIVDNLTTADKSKVLSANMGVELNKKKSDRYTLPYVSQQFKLPSFKIGEIRANIGVNLGGCSFILSGGNNYGSTSYQKTVVSFSPRGYSGSGNIPSNLVNTLNISADSSNYSSYKFITKLRGDKLELWYVSYTQWLHKVSIDVISSTDFYFNEDMKWMEKPDDLETDTYKVFDIKLAIHEKSPLFLGNSGVSSIIYIQDAGEKTAGNGYVDKTTGQLYLCKTTNSDTSVTNNFVLATNIENRNRISIIEEKLGIYHPVGKISTISVSRDENSSSPTLSFSSL